MAGSRLTLPVTVLYGLAIWIISGVIQHDWWIQLGCHALACYLMILFNNFYALIRVYSRAITSAEISVAAVSLASSRTIKLAYHTLGLASFLTAGPKEVRAWTFRRGWKAPKCAGVIHTDFEKGFIRAQVVSFDDYIKYGGEKGAREAGALRPEGKEYEMQDGDVVEFMFN